MNVLREPRIIIALLLMAVIGAGVATRDGEYALTLEAYADRVVKACAAKGYRPSCYDEEIPRLMDTISMEDAFRVTYLVQEKDPSYRYCHVLGHNLSAQEVRKDPSRWKEVASRCPSGMCSNGCIHGGFQERFRAESFTDEQVQMIKPDLQDLCEARENWRPTGLEQASCYHAVGHLVMYITDAALKKSLALCDEIAKKSDGRDFRRVCYDGVFMQIFQPLEPEDFALIQGKEVAKEHLETFCAGFTGAARSSCWSEGWPLFRMDIETPDGLVRYCGKAEPAEENRCYDALEHVVTAQFGFDEERIVPFCSGLPARRTARCFANAASRMIETDYRNVNRSVSLCARGAPFDTAGLCFRELIFYATYNFHPGADEAQRLCEALPAAWRGPCTRREITSRPSE